MSTATSEEGEWELRAPEGHVVRVLARQEGVKGLRVVTGSKVEMWAGGRVVYGGEEAVLRGFVERWKEAGLGGESMGQQAAIEGAVAAAGHGVASMERWLSLRTYSAGHSPSWSDLFWLSSLLLLPPPSSPNLRRWRSLVTAHFALSDLSSSSSASAGPSVNLGSQGSFAKMELTGARMGEVVVRFPPEPSGYLHIGHIKAVLLNDYYRRTYQGKLIVRFDDTNPVKEKDEYVQSILQDLKALEVEPDMVSYTSDNFQYILDRARELIQRGAAYVDDQDRDTIRAQRMKEIQSPARQLPVEEHLRRWDEMIKGSEEGCRCVLRAFIPLEEQTNSAMRDPALARCLGPEVEHARTGKRFRCYPTYDLAIACCDALEGVTHAMRDSQYEERVPLYHWMLKQLQVPAPPIIRQFSRINFLHTILSKRKLQFFVDQGMVTGWDDPALPTVRGVLNRGLSVEALRLFILNQGASLSRTNMSMSKLWAINKKLVDPVAPRYVAISNECYTLVLDGPEGELPPAGEEGEVVERPLHPKNPEVGVKHVNRGRRMLVEAVDARLLEKDEEFTLLDWGNAVLTERDDDKRLLHARLHLQGDVKKTKRKVGWVLAGAGCPAVTLVTIGDLITVPTLPQKKEGQPEVDWTTVINPKLKESVLCCGERAMAGLKKGAKVQIVRRGFFCVLEASEDGTSMTLVDIPDGKESGASVLVAGKK